MTQIRPLRQLPAIIPEPTRFDLRRQAAADRAALEYGASLTKEAKEKLAKAESLFSSAAAMDPGPRANARAEAVRTLQAAFAELAEVITEFRS